MSDTKAAEAQLAHAELVHQLGSSLGHEKAEAAVRETLLRLGWRARERYTRDEVERLLDTMAHTKGLVGTVARFAKARLILLMDG